MKHAKFINKITRAHGTSTNLKSFNIYLYEVWSDLEEAWDAEDENRRYLPVQGRNSSKTHNQTQIMCPDQCVYVLRNHLYIGSIHTYTNTIEKCNIRTLNRYTLYVSHSHPHDHKEKWYFFLYLDKNWRRKKK